MLKETQELLPAVIYAWLHMLVIWLILLSHTHTYTYAHTHRCSFFLFRRTTINLGSFGHESSQNKEKVFKINRGCWLPFLLQDLWTRPNEWSGSSDCPTLHWSSWHQSYRWRGQWHRADPPDRESKRERSWRGRWPGLKSSWHFGERAFLPYFVYNYTINIIFIYS